MNETLFQYLWVFFRGAYISTDSWDKWTKYMQSFPCVITTWFDRDLLIFTNSNMSEEE